MAPVKLHWIVNKQKREATLRRRRATLLRKARELSTMCDVPVAAVVYAGASDVEPAATWPPEDARARAILGRFQAQPYLCRGSLDREAFLRDCIGKEARTWENLKAGNRDREVTLVLNEFSLRRRHNLDGLSPELASAVMSVLEKRARTISWVLMSPTSSQAPASAAAAPAVVPVAQEPPVVPPTAMAPVVADAALVSPLEADVDSILKEYGFYDSV